MVNPLRVCLVAISLTVACSARSTTEGLPDGGGTVDTDSGATSSVCTQYCTAATTACPTYVMGDCVSNCATQYNRLTPACQASAAAYFRCAFSMPVMCGSDGRPSLSFTTCQTELGPFLMCVGASADGGA